MDSGFTSEHFDLLHRWGTHRWTGSPEQQLVHKQLASAYRATESWAKALQQRLFPLGKTEIRKAVVNQGKNFSTYTWARIYPRITSQKLLAYTVGIDKSGDFIVKIDTNNARDALWKSYERIRGPIFSASPIAAVLPAKRGLALSFEALVEWSTSAIESFELTYDEVARALGLTDLHLRLVENGDLVKTFFSQWRSYMTEGSIRQNGVLWIPDARIVLNTQTTDGRIRTVLGVDPKGENWSVEINEPREVGNHSSLSAIAVNATNQYFLIRQGVLKRNNQSIKDISPKDFATRTGLKPVAVEGLEGNEERLWFVVAALDMPSDAVRQMTGRFVDNCVQARSVSAEPQPSTPQPSHFLLGADEKGGTYVVPAKPALSEHIVLRQHGIVWLKLREILAGYGIEIQKPQHWLGHAVDAEIKRSAVSPPLLIEIKTSTSAGDLHTGVGQLHLYRKLIPGLMNHEPVLLLPKAPAPELIAAIKGTGISIHTFSLIAYGDEADVSFDSDFLEKCRA